MAGKDEETEKLVLYLPAGTKDALREAAKRSGLGERGMSEEVRRRLDASFAADKFTPHSRYLGALVTNIAESAEDYFGYWGQNSFAHQVLVSAIRTVLDTMQPFGDAEPKFNPKSIADILFDPKDSPDQIARTLVAAALASTPNIRTAGG